MTDVTLAIAVELLRLPPGQREVVRRRYFDESTFCDIASALGVSTSWAQAQHQRAIRRLGKSTLLREISGPEPPEPSPLRRGYRKNLDELDGTYV